MARHSDIRTYLGKRFPLIRLSGNIDYIDQIVASASPEDEPDTIKHFNFNDVVESVTTVKPGIVRLNDASQSYQIQDLVKVRYEFSTLLLSRGDMLYSDIFFKKGNYPAGLAIDQNELAALNAKVYSAAMKRAYNWHRFGSDGDIHIAHQPGNTVLATIIISEVSFVKAEPVIHYSILVGDEVLETTLQFPYAIKNERKSTKATPTDIPYDQFLTLLSTLRRLGYGDSAFTLVDKLSSGLQARQGNGPVDVYIHPGVPGRMLKATCKPEDGGVLFYEIHTVPDEVVLISEQPMSLINLRHATSKYWEKAAPQELMVNVSRFSEDLFEHPFFEDADVYNVVMDALRLRIKRGDKALSHVHSKSIKLRYVSWNEGEPYYSLECLRNGKLFVFKDFIDMSDAITTIKIELKYIQPKTERPKLGFIPRLKTMFGGLFA
jgi:hypothetical protein